MTHGSLLCLFITGKELLQLLPVKTVNLVLVYRRYLHTIGQWVNFQSEFLWNTKYVVNLTCNFFLTIITFIDIGINHYLIKCTNHLWYFHFNCSHLDHTKHFQNSSALSGALICLTWNSLTSYTNRFFRIRLEKLCRPTSKYRYPAHYPIIETPQLTTIKPTLPLPSFSDYTGSSVVSACLHYATIHPRHKKKSSSPTAQGLCLDAFLT